MRQLIVRVPGRCGGVVLSIAERHRAANLARWEAEGSRGERHDVVVVHLANERVGPFVDDLEAALRDVHVSLVDAGALALHPPTGEVARQTRDVTPRSPLEVYVAGLQSIGAWKGFLGYAAIAGVVVWIGLTTNTVALLVGAMLIAPFASPAMNAALATARGDVRLLAHSLARYGAALGVTAGCTALLTLLSGASGPTAQMVAAVNVSPYAMLLPLAAGAAGALTLCQSQRGSLVSGAGAGLLVAASLAPPAGIVGIAAVTGRWEMAVDAAFLLALQLAGIELAGAVVFRLFGVRPRGRRYLRGSARAAWIAGTLSAAALGGLVVLQFASPKPGLVRAGEESRARDTVIELFRRDPALRLIHVEAAFPRDQASSRHPLLVRVYLLPRSAAAAADTIRAEAARRVRDTVARRVPNVTPLVDVVVLDAPPQGGN